MAGVKGMKWGRRKGRARHRVSTRGYGMRTFTGRTGREVSRRREVYKIARGVRGHIL